jgi:hypothetical protein
MTTDVLQIKDASAGTRIVSTVYHDVQFTRHSINLTASFPTFGVHGRRVDVWIMYCTRHAARAVAVIDCECFIGVR